jgi:hypothetical protein
MGWIYSAHAACRTAVGNLKGRGQWEMVEGNIKLELGRISLEMQKGLSLLRIVLKELVC